MVEWLRSPPEIVGAAGENPGVTAAVCEPVAALSDALEGVRGSLRGLDDKMITQALREVEVVSRKAQSVMLDLVAEIDSRGVAGRAGFGATQRLLASVLHLSMAEARMRVEHAGMVGARSTLSGETLPPRLPATAAALAAGEIGTGQLRVITETMTLLPASVPEPARERIEADLAGYAQDFDPRRLRIIARRLLDVVDPDGPEPAAEDPTPAIPVRGELWLRNRRDGSLGLEGWLDSEHASLVRGVIEQLAARRPTSPEGVPDERSVPQRQADALIELCQRARAEGEVPTTGGEPPHVTVTLDWDALRTGVTVGLVTPWRGELRWQSCWTSTRVCRDLVMTGNARPQVKSRTARPGSRNMGRRLVRCTSIAGARRGTRV